MEKIKSFQDLVVWQKGHELVLGIYKETGNFPKEERLGLISQMRRAAVSIPANVAEGFRRRSSKDKINFYNISQCSLEELRYYLILSRDLGFKLNFENLWESTEEVSKLLNGSINSLKQ